MVSSRDTITITAYANDAASQRDPFLLPTWEAIDLQDYRNRHASYVAHDEGLRNLRRRVPLIGSWDDHETANDSWSCPKSSGAENHQPVCPANASSTDAEKIKAECDQNEGDAVTRFQSAVRAYFEWMPVRYTPDGPNGRMNGTDNKVFQWGSLSTLVTVDTRLTDRTHASGERITDFSGFALKYPNISAYYDLNSTEYAALQAFAAPYIAAKNSPNESMAGRWLSFVF